MGTSAQVELVMRHLGLEETFSTDRRRERKIWPWQKINSCRDRDQLIPFMKGISESKFDEVHWLLQSYRRLAFSPINLNLTFEQTVWIGEDLPRSQPDTLSNQLARFIQRVQARRNHLEEDQFCVIAANGVKKETALSLPRYPQTSSRHSPEALVAKSLAGAYLMAVGKAWQLPPDRLRDSFQLLNQLNEEGLNLQILPEQSILLPSQANRRDMRLDITQKLGMTLALEWPNVAPQYVSDFVTYVRQPHCQRPSLEKLELVVIDEAETNRKGRDMFLFVKSGSFLERLRLADYSTEFDYRAHAHEPQSTHIRILSVILIQVRDDITQFVEESGKTVNKVLMMGRSNPSNSKLELLLHCQDCLSMGSSACDKLIDQISNLKFEFETLLQQRRRTYTWLAIHYLETLSNVEKDMRYLSKACHSILGQIQPIKRDIAERIGPSQNWRTLVITILVAAYVPLSFVSSFFGMNLISSSQSSSSSQSVQLINNGTHMGLIAKRLTPQILQRDDSLSQGENYLEGNVPWENVGLAAHELDSSPKLWSLQQYFYIAIPLMVVTILCPLFAGTVSRWVAQKLFRYKTLISLIFILFAIGYFYIVSSYLYADEVWPAIFLGIFAPLWVYPIPQFFLNLGRFFWLLASNQDQHLRETLQKALTLCLWLGWFVVVLLSYLKIPEINPKTHSPSIPQPRIIVPWVVLGLFFACVTAWKHGRNYLESLSEKRKSYNSR